MGRSQDSFSKREKEKKRLKKRQEKEAKKKERKENSSGGGLDNMMAYVDEFGNILDTPPDPSEKEEIDAESIEIGVPKREEVEDDGIHTGRLQFWNDSKGFGFIKDHDDQEQYFVHVSNMEGDIQEGDKVTYELEEGQKGLNAVNVRKV